MRGPDKLIRQETLSPPPPRARRLLLLNALPSFPERAASTSAAARLFVLDFLEREEEWRMGNAERANDLLSLVSSYDAKNVTPVTPMKPYYLP